MSDKPANRLIYLASPYSHDDPAIRQQRFTDVAMAAGTLIGLGHMIYSPIAHNHPIAEILEMPGTGWEFWKEYDRHMIGISRQVWILTLDGWYESVGVSAERCIAQGLGIGVYYIDPIQLFLNPRKEFEELWKSRIPPKYKEIEIPQGAKATIIKAVSNGKDITAEFQTETISTPKLPPKSTSSESSEPPPASNQPIPTPDESAKFDSIPSWLD